MQTFTAYPKFSLNECLGLDQSALHSTFSYGDTKSCNTAKRKGAEGVEGLVEPLAHGKWNSGEIC